MRYAPVRICAFAALVLLGLMGRAPVAGAVEIERVVSPGGIEAWLVEERSIPIIAVSFAVPRGQVAAFLGPNEEFATDRIRLHYESMVTPGTVYDYHLTERRLETMKVREVPSGYDLLPFIDTLALGYTYFEQDGQPALRLSLAERPVGNTCLLGRARS